MSSLFEEIDFQPTPIGAISLRRRREMSSGIDVFEIKLGDEFLMSSLFTASEIALAQLALANLPGDNLDVLVGGLGLGHTANEVLKNANVTSMMVVEMLDAVIEWHRTGLVPLGTKLSADRRCEIRQGDFFELANRHEGFDMLLPERQFDAILLDIDHSPEALLDDRSSDFYRQTGLRQLARHVKPGGRFGLWSNDKPDPAFTRVLKQAFGNARAEPVEFFNPIQERYVTQTVYLAFKTPEVSI